MNSFFRFFPGWACQVPGFFLGLWTTVAGAEAAEDKPVSFYREVLPIFEAHCHGCHQPAKAKGNYVMTDFAKLIEGVEQKPAISPGQAGQSPLLAMITPAENGEAEMPQKRPALHPVQIELIRSWIAQGAVNDTPADAGKKYSPEHPPVYGSAPVVASLDWSPDGKWIAATGHHEVLIHSADGGAAPIRLIGLSERIESLAFSPDGSLLAVAGGNPGKRGEVQIWKLEDQSLKWSHPVTYDTVYGVSWSPDGRFIAFGCGDHGDNSVRALDVSSGKEVLSNSAHGDWALDTAWSKDGSHLISVGRDMAAKLTEVASQRFIDNITSITPGALRGGLHAVARHPQRDEALLGGADGVPQIYRMHRETKRVIGDDANLIRRYAAMPGRIFGLAWKPDGSAFAAVSSHDAGGTVRLLPAAYDPAMPSEIKSIVEKVADSQAPEERKKLQDYVTAGTGQIANRNFPGDRLFGVAWHPDGSRLAVAGTKGQIRILEDGTLREMRAIPVAAVDPAALVRLRPARPAALPAVAVPGQVAEPAIAPESVRSLTLQPSRLRLEGLTDTAQILITATLHDGTAVDATRAVRLESPLSIATVDSQGMVQATRDGEGILQFSLGQSRASLPVEVTGTLSPLHPDYVRDVMPVLSRLGCNTGTCHGSKDGRNGFKLSLRGYDPQFDVLALTDEQASRRSNPAVPDSSFFLQKASAAVPHEGGQLTPPGEDAYEILRAWIADGGKVNYQAPRVTSITVDPQNPVVQKIGSRQQMRVLATYANGKVRDVTALSFVESGNPDVATAARGGLVSTLRRGEAPVLARFEGAYAATTVTVMGDRTGFVWNKPESWTVIDTFVASKWERMKIEPSGLCSDTEFLRRVSLDLTGLPPGPDEVRAFLADTRDTRIKREAAADRLIGSPAFIDHWSNKWASLLQVNGKFLAREGAQAFREWIRTQVEKNTPWDRMVHSILTASGSNRENPPAAYYKILRTPEETMENTTHLFLATRFNCNKCHDHPFERWTQDQYYQTSAWFAQVQRKADPESKGRTVGGSAVEGAQPLYEIASDAPTGEVLHDRTKQVTAPNFPYPAKFEQKPDMSRREQLAGWMVSPDNRYFALSFVNRIWGYLLGTGLIEPLDDIRAGNPPSNPELLDHLRDQFIAGGFDVRNLIRSIVTSRTYQLSISTNRWNADDTVNFSHAQARRLPAEALYDSIMTVTGTTPKIPGVPPGTRASALPDSSLDLPSGFLANLGRPVRESACECERSNDVQLGPVMSLLGGPVVADSIADPANAVASLTQSVPDDRKLAEEIFLRVLSRPARPAEVDAAMQVQEHLAQDHQTLVRELGEAEAGWAVQRVEAEVQRKQQILTARSTLEEYQPEAKRVQEAAKKTRQETIARLEQSIRERDQALAAPSSVPSPASPAATYRAKVISARATGGTVLTAQEDESLLVSGPNVNGSYKITIEPSIGRITGIVLETLRDHRLPSGGPGRAPNGNFVLNRISGQWISLPDASAKGPLEFSAAHGSFEQPNFPASLAIGAQAEAGKGWALAGAPPTSHFAAFALKHPIDQPAGARLEIELHFAYGSDHNLGRFRLRVTNAADPLQPGGSADEAHILTLVPNQRSAEQQAHLLAEAQEADEVRGRLLGELATAGAPVPPNAHLLELERQVAKAELPVPVPPRIVRLRNDVEQSIGQMANRRLTSAQDLVWALINSPEFLFNH